MKIFTGIKDGYGMKKISSKISVIIMCCSCLAVLLLGGISLMGGIELVKADAEDKLVWMSRHYAGKFSNQFERLEDKVQEIDVFMKETIDVKRLKEDKDYLGEYEPQLATFIKKFAENRTDSIAGWVFFDPKWSDTPHDVYYVDGDGDKIPDRQQYIPFSYYDHTPTQKDDKYWWYGPIEAKRGIWTNPYEWTLVNDEVIKVVSYAQPLYIHGEFIGVIGSYYRFDQMRKDIEAIKVYEHGYATLFNEKLDVIIHPEYFAGTRNTSDNLERVADGKLREIVAQIKDSPYGIVHYEQNGEKKLFAYSKLSNGWVMGINPPINEMYAGVYTLAWKLLIAVLICIVFSMFASWAMGKYISKPILKMVDATKKIGTGDFSTRVDVGTKDETKILADSLNDMAGNIRNLQNNLVQVAYYDALTGLANKNLFEKTAREFIDCKATNKYAYVLLDINKFKLINDIFGVEQGDALLGHIAEALSKEAKDKEICARFNADMFHCFFLYTSKDALEERINAIYARITLFTFEDNVDYKLSVGFGIYVGEDRLLSISSMGDKAKLALSKIKGLRNVATYFYNDDIRDKIIEEQEIENTMEAALQNKEFKLYLQPKYDVQNYRLRGAEALVRWENPTKGVIAPNEFIPVFEKNGFISELDMYMLSCVCQKINEWISKGIKPVPISVNVSRQYLHHPNYVDRLIAILAKYHTPHALVELEITETTMFENEDGMVGIIKNLHQEGFKISMDDFGSGYSSLNMLQDIMVDVLKIDRVFFKESVNSVRGQKIVSNIISMARDLNIEVVAEGIETKEQLIFLQTTNCNLAQGYYFSKPVPTQDFDLLVKKEAAKEQQE